MMKETSNEVSQNQNVKTRLVSLDYLRGADLFLLVFLQPVLMAFLEASQAEWSWPIMKQLDHEVWQGFRFWDLIMPLFLFMSGTSIPFALSKFKGDVDKSAVYRKILKRFIYLFILGMIVQGNLLSLRVEWFKPYTNTLQAIAAGYLITSLLYLHLNTRGLIISLFTLLLCYSIPMQLFGDFTLTGNFAYFIDDYVLGSLRGDISYTWIWSTFTFAATVLIGALTGIVIRKGKDSPKEVVKNLFVYGMVLLAVGLLLSSVEPIIKRIWTSSMTLFSCGLCSLLMSLFYWLFDYKKYRLGLNWLLYYGTNSILAYMLGEVINFRSIAQSVFYGLEPILQSYYQAFLMFVNFAILFSILRFLYKRNIFWKV